jgi:hypothetical protein
MNDSTADDEAHASMLAWALGPEVFVAHLKQKIAAIKERIERDHAASDRAGKPETEADPT